MKIKILSILSITILLASCSGDPDAWTDERKQIITDKCDNEVFDCDCYLKTTMEAFPKAQDYNTILGDETANQVKVDEYWDKVYDGCMTE